MIRHSSVCSDLSITVIRLLNRTSRLVVQMWGLARLSLKNGLTFDQMLSIQAHVNTKNVLLFGKERKIIVHTIIVSNLDYCNVLCSKVD